MFPCVYIKAWLFTLTLSGVGTSVIVTKQLCSVSLPLYPAAFYHKKGQKSAIVTSWVDTYCTVASRISVGPFLKLPTALNFMDHMRN